MDKPDEKKEEPEKKTAIQETTEIAIRSLGEGIARMVTENIDQPYLYIPAVRRTLEALERLSALSPLRMGEVGGLGQNPYALEPVAEGVGGLVPLPRRGLRGDATMGAIQSVVEVLQPLIQTVSAQQRVPALRAVLDSKLCSDEARQKAADELSRLVVEGEALAPEQEAQKAADELLAPDAEEAIEEAPAPAAPQRLGRIGV